MSNRQEKKKKGQKGKLAALLWKIHEDSKRLQKL